MSTSIEVVIFLLALAVASKIDHVLASDSRDSERRLEDDCKTLILDVCERNNRLAAKELLVHVQRLKSKSPWCVPLEAKTTKSLSSFTKFICNQPVESCKVLKRKLKCKYEQECAFLGHLENFYGWGNQIERPAVFKIAEDFGKLKCMVKEAKSETVVAKCVKRDGMNWPQEPEEFLQWYYDEADMDKLTSIITFCTNAKAINEGCAVRTIKTVAYCKLADGYAKELLKYRLKKAKYIDITKAAEDYCKEDKMVRQKLGDWLDEDGKSESRVEKYINEDLHSKFQLRYALCHLKDQDTVDFVHKKGLCYAQAEKKQGNNCFLTKTGDIPNESSKLVEWLCKDDYKIDDTDSTGDYEDLAKSCIHKTEVAYCNAMVESKHVICSARKKMTPIIHFKRILYADRLKHVQDCRIRKKMNCLSIVNENALNDCYNKVGKLTGASAIKGEKLYEAICNEEWLTSFLSLTECLTGHKIEKEYIDACQEGNHYGWFLKFNQIKTCTLPLYGKKAEDCYTKHIKRPPFASESDLDEWKKNIKHPNDIHRLDVIQACLKLVRKSDEGKHEKCLSDLESTSKYRKFVYQICEQGQNDTAARVLADLSCGGPLEAEGGECSKVVSSFKAISSTAKFLDWFCDMKETNKDTYIKLRECIEDFRMRKHDEYWACRNEKEQHL